MNGVTICRTNLRKVVASMCGFLSAHTCSRIQRHTRQTLLTVSHVCSSQPSQRRGYTVTATHFSEATSSQHDRTFIDEPTSKSSLDETERDKFDFAHTWWDESGEAAALHTLNALRVPFIRDGLLQQASVESSAGDTGPQPLQGLRLLDIGCGGGLLSESLARLGANVRGIDTLEENISVARWHASLSPRIEPRLTYSCGLVEELADSPTESFDGVVCSEVLEHVANPDQFVASCCELVKPGGSVFFTTISKTYLSYALAVVAAEQIFRIVKAGSHDWNKFVTPDDLQAMLKENDMHTHLIHGMTLNPLTLKWCWVKDTSVNYALHAVKPTTESAEMENTSQDASK